MSQLQDLKDNLSRAVHNMTKSEAFAQRVCVSCKKPPTFYSDAGRREYNISGLCEPCFDNITNPIVSCCGKHLEDCTCL